MVASRRIAIVQSNYVPWRGYFDLIGYVDEFVLLDDVQYTRRDWRNRNRIKTQNGTRWLTIPVQVSGRYTQTIAEARVADDDWASRHWATVRQSYRDARGFDAAAPLLGELYASVPGPSLSEVNRHFLEAICERLEIETPLTQSHDYGAAGTRTVRLLEICREAGATTYVSGPSAKEYLDEGAFEAAGISVEWFEYGPYPEYEQVHPPFEPHVSILDTLLCAGEAAATYVRPAKVA